MDLRGQSIMDIRPIKTEADYEATLAEIEGLMGAQADSPEGDRLEVLSLLVEAFEARRYPIDLPDGVSALKFEMDRRGLAVKDLEPYLGRTNRVYEVLNRRRKLSLRMIWNLHQGLGIPLEILLKPGAPRG
jgi:HTH-type transcriptional regulator/antitoxin HigA